ncbi:uncharacterized protein [Ptychodera flava]|uniref:uncharacterized protein isoform X2 n=1 Tax=Ptychodera flava TaxID=63121 RepID=UPI00396A1586
MCRRVPNNSSDTVVSRPHLEVGKFSTMPKKKYWKKSAAKKKSVGPVKTAVCDTSLGGASTSKIVFPVKVADTTRCPTCNKMFDLVTIRPLIDTCGHVRCSLCMFSLEECSLCSGSHGPKSDIVQNPSVEVNISDVSDTVSQIGDSIAAGKCGEQGDQCLEERVTSSTNKQILQPEPMVDKNSPAMAVNDVDGQDGLQFIKRSVGRVKTAVCDTSLGDASTSKFVFPVKDADKTRCQTCNKVFDLVTIRPLIDTCGHVRCSLCMFSVEECPLCSGSHGPKSYIVQNASVEVNISDVSDTVSQIGVSSAAGKCGEQGDQCLEERVTSATNKQISWPEPMVDEISPAKAVNNVNGQDGLQFIKRSDGPVKTAICNTTGSLGGASTSNFVFPVKVADKTRCPTCNKVFDLVTIRPLIDTCGHVRCSLCMFPVEECPLCSGTHGPKSDIVQNPSVEVNISDVSDTVSQIGDSIAAGKCGEQGDQCLEERVTSSTNKQISRPEPMVDEISPAKAVNNVNGQDGLQFIKRSVGPVKMAICDTTGSLGGASTSNFVFPVKVADKTRCPTCNKVFDLVTIRPLIDTCGHVRCSLCMFPVEECPLCSGSHGPKSYIVQNPSVEVNISDVSDTVSQIGDSIAAGKCGEQGDQCLEERVTSATNKQILQPEPMADDNSLAQAVGDVVGQDGHNCDNASDVLMTARVETDKTVDRVLADVRELFEDEQFKGVRTQSTGMEGDSQIYESHGVPDSGEVKTKKDANHSMQCDDGKQTTNVDDSTQINSQADGTAIRKSSNRKYKCSGCGEIFQTKLAAQRHVAVHMFSGRDFDCDLCGVNFKDHMDYARHMYAGKCEQDGGISDGEEKANDGDGGLSSGRMKKEEEIKRYVFKHCGDVLKGV